MTVTSLLTIALTLLAWPATAQAEQRMPAELTGEWCIVSTEADQKGDFPLMYRRGKCPPDSDGPLAVTRDGYRGHEENCKLVKSTMDTATRVYRMQFRCQGEGDTWIEDSSMVRTMGVILRRHHGQVR
jgi:hypothetical protein